ncbi:hypothetical protein NBRC10512_005694 [Rhodotorula toruloides]|uniref:RHTO0S02e08394g1_1 n=2 Tax=Rhodotorula toruloides TaxID=5286 RepID=A0A061AIG0_RHOTO|nr:uncharacterized protein RHTO_05246 [Rhodotorula toruloides NP11]EMS19083.1 hypothetical protein RHTO_05246 [Rhodotorula toruloides NP11]CDR36907.1 RHTO0S02e08394g1_1 [Rhodotorula toruloides]
MDGKDAMSKEVGARGEVRPVRRKRSRSRHHHSSKKGQGLPAMYFHFSLSITLAAIAVVWSVTPLSWVYVLWTVLTSAIPALRPGRPATVAPSPLVFRILHYITLTYCSVECAFSIWYKWKAYQCQKLREAPTYSRKYLRGVFLRALENGIDIEEELAEEAGEGAKGGDLGEQEWAEDPRDEEEATRGSDGELSSKRPATSTRRRASRQFGDGSNTPDLQSRDGGDYLSARPAPSDTRSTRSANVSQSLNLVQSRASLDSRDEGYGGDISRLSLRSTESSSKRPHPHSRFIPHLSPSDPRAHDFRHLLVHWFTGPRDLSFTDLKRDDVAQWLAWSLYGKPLEELEKQRAEWDKAGRPALYCADGVTLDDDADLEDEEDEKDGEDATRRQRRREEALEADPLGLVNFCVSLVELRSAHKFAPGSNPAVKPMRLTLDPVRVTSRPFLLYLVVAALQNAVIAHAKAKGFKEARDDETITRALVRVPPGWAAREDLPEDERPLVFIHGLGMGLAQYTTLVSVLASSRALRRRPIMVLIQPAISMSIFERGYLSPPDQQRSSKGIERLMRRFGFDERAGGATVFSHSNGSIVHGWLLKDCPTLATRNCFVDPVAFSLWEPWVCRHALYSPTKQPMEYLMRYFVMRELGVANLLSRHFNWTSNLLFPSEVPNLSDPQKTAIFLASEDSILDASRMRAYLRRQGLREVSPSKKVGEVPGGGGLKVFQGFKHGESMIGKGEPFAEVLSWVTWDERSPSAYERGPEAWSSTDTAGDASP